MKKIILGILVSMLVIISGFSIVTASVQNNPPNIPSDPHPADGAIDIGMRTRLSWTGGDPDPGDKAVYHLYFGTDEDPGLIAEDLTKPSYRPPGGLEELTQYYWYVVAEDKSGATTTGLTWTFTTKDCPQINLVALQ